MNNGEEMNILSRIKDKAISKKRRVVLPEGSDPRTIQAAKKILSEGIASVTILGDTDKVSTEADSHILKVTGYPLLVAGINLDFRWL